jgi:prophage regulatory protein
MSSSNLRLISRAELRTLVPYTLQHILRLEKMGRFPRRIRLGANRVAWLEHDIARWIEARIAERDAERPQ